jgi:hypothetical protein
LPDVVNAIQPFMSGINIDKGTRWAEILNSNLQESACAIVCLTPESLSSVWVAFEAGAVSRAAGSTDGARARIWTYLSGLENKDIQLTPYAEYQSTSETEEETFRLISSINQLSPDPVAEETLKRRFDAVFWPNFTNVLERVHAMPTNSSARWMLAATPESDMLSEILLTVRSVQRELRRSSERTSSGEPSARKSRARLLWERLKARGIDSRIQPHAVGSADVLIHGKVLRLSPNRYHDVLVDDESLDDWLRESYKMPGLSIDPPKDIPKE